MVTHDDSFVSGFKVYNGLTSFDDDSFEKELTKCESLGLKAEVLRKYNFNALQLAEIRKGLEAGIDVKKYLNPKLSWLEMEEMRLEAIQGIDMTSYREQNFSSSQIYQIRRGIYENVDVSLYAKKEFLAEQMKQIRKGLVFSKDFPVIFYLDPEFDFLQMREIRKGLEAQIDVADYAHVDIPYLKMRVVRESAEDGFFLTEEQIKNYSYGILDQLHKAFIDGVDLSDYIAQKYDSDQLEEIRSALVENLPIDDYISPDIRSDAIHEIRLGIENGVIVDQYANVAFNWQQMREMRLGLEHGIDITPLCQPLYWADQMHELRLGLEEGIDISKYSSMMYTAKDMRRVRQQLMLGTFVDKADATLKSKEPAAKSSKEEVLLYMLEHKDDFISFTHERMLCWFKPIDVPQIKEYTEDIIMSFLTKCGISFGINRQEIKRIAKEGKTGKEQLVASGIDAVNGNDGYYEYFFDLPKECELSENEDGTADFSNLDSLIKINVGDVIAKYHRSTLGTDGFDVFGKKLFAKKGREIPMLKGAGFMVLNDKVTYVSRYTGALSMHDGNIFIKKILVMSEVKITDKVVRYDGTVFITGDVNSGSEIRASGDIVISGHMESSLLVSGGNVSIKGGATCPVRGGIDAKGNVSAKFLEGVKVNAMNVYANSFVNCNILAKGIVKTFGKDGVIYGGTTQSFLGIETANLGSKGGAKTIVSLGAVDNLYADHMQRKKELERDNEELQTLETEKIRLNELGVKNREMLQWKIRISAAVDVKKKMINERIAEIKAIEETLNKSAKATASISNHIYAGVIFVIGGVIHKIDQDKPLYSTTTVRVDGKRENIIIV